MIDCKVDHETNDYHLNFNGNILDLVQETSFLVMSVYSALKKKDVDAADIYKRSVQLCIKEDNSPVWG